MLRRILGQQVRRLIANWMAGAPDRSGDELQIARHACLDGDFEKARRVCESVLERRKNPDAAYLLGVVACVGRDADAGATALGKALEIYPANPQYLAALADARLLQQREEDALSLYATAFPALAREIGGITDEGAAWKKVHPDWLKPMRRVTLALDPAMAAGANRRRRLHFEDVAPAHLLNWALLLVSRRRINAASFLLQRVTSGQARLPYAHAVLAMLQTFNRDWKGALASAQSARRMETEVFPASNHLCIISAQFELRYRTIDLDPVFDWRAFDDTGESSAHSLERLPHVDWPRPLDPDVAGPYFFIACDTTYLFDHAIALVASIRKHCSNGAVCLHLFSPDTRTYRALDALAGVLAPLPLFLSSEAVDFDKYGGKGLYCSCARFCRLFQLVGRTDQRVVMIDADSLVRGDVGSALSGSRDIGLARAEREPFWHRYLAGFTAFRRSHEALVFLEQLSTFLAMNLSQRKAGPYIDQVALHLCASHCIESHADAVEHLPVEIFCDTLFHDRALVWSVTQDKDRDGAFARYKHEILQQLPPDLRAGGRMPAA